MSHARNGKATDRIKKGTGERPHNERYWVTGEICTRCSEPLEFYRYIKTPRPEPTVCAQCAALQWAEEKRGPRH